ncbi:MAG: hypothetical protein M3Z33_05620 [Actinomycetota bacterium]|nr:hypothetical protein [Actinomycetota bacterium]
MTERLAAGVLRNESIVSPLVAVEASVWLPPEVDADRAAAVLGAEAVDGRAQVAEVTADGVRLTVTVEAAPAPERSDRQADLRAALLRRLRAHGLLARDDSNAPSDARARPDG